MNRNVLETRVIPVDPASAIHNSGRLRRLSRLLTCAVIALFAIGWTAAIASAADPVGTQYCDGLGAGGSGTGTSTTPGDTGGMAGGTQSSGGTDCGQDVGGVQEPGSSTPPASSPSPSSGSDAGTLSGHVGTLPFTGWDLISLVAIALALCAGGVALSRLSARSRSQN